MKAALTFFILPTFYASVAFCQVNIAGKVISTSGNLPVAGASVYVNNTSIGTVTNEAGEFNLKSDYAGKIELVVSHLAFERKIMSLTSGPLQSLLTINLDPKSNRLNEVEILGSSSSGWKRWHNLFTDYFIGTSEFAKSCTIKNPEALIFHYNKAEKQLKVTSRDKLIVENRALGYLYKIDLNEFSYSFGTFRLKSDITVLFENIKPADTAMEKLLYQEPQHG